MSDASDKLQACARVVPRDFRAKSGVEIFDGVFLGKFLGAGVQAAVYELVFADGHYHGSCAKARTRGAVAQTIPGAGWPRR